MNLLEHYIKEIHSVTESKAHKDMLIIELTYDCYGYQSTTLHYTTKEEWEQEKKQGYYLA